MVCALPVREWKTIDLTDGGSECDLVDRWERRGVKDFAANPDIPQGERWSGTLTYDSSLEDVGRRGIRRIVKELIEEKSR